MTELDKPTYWRLAGVLHAMQFVEHMQLANDQKLLNRNIRLKASVLDAIKKVNTFLKEFKQTQDFDTFYELSAQLSDTFVELAKLPAEKQQEMAKKFEDLIKEVKI